MVGTQRTKRSPASVVAAAGGVVLCLLGLFAMVSPSTFFESIARFEPYNAHFLRDIGAFQIGLGAVLLFAAAFTSDALTAATLGVGLGAAAHLVSHLIDLDAGGSPLVDVPVFAITGGVLLAVGIHRWRRVAAGTADAP